MGLDRAAGGQGVLLLGKDFFADETVDAEAPGVAIDEENLLRAEQGVEGKLFPTAVVRADLQLGKTFPLRFRVTMSMKIAVSSPPKP